jgi:hypothetical protein
MKTCLFVVFFLLLAIMVQAEINLQAEIEEAEKIEESKWETFEKSEPITGAKITSDLRRSFFAESLGFPTGTRMSLGTGDMIATINGKDLTITSTFKDMPKGEMPFSDFETTVTLSENPPRLGFSIKYKKHTSVSQNELEDLYDMIAKRPLIGAFKEVQENCEFMTTLNNPLSLKDYNINYMLLMKEPNKMASKEEIRMVFGPPHTTKKITNDIWDYKIPTESGIPILLSITFDENGYVTRFIKV